MLLVVKLGSNLIQTSRGDIDLAFLSKLAGEIKALREEGINVLLVSSGAVLCGV